MIEPVVMPGLLWNILRNVALKKSLSMIFQSGETLEITSGPFKGFLGFFEKIQTLPWLIQGYALDRNFRVCTEVTNSIAAP